MQVVNPVCCGLDVGKQEVVACLRITRGKEVHKELREFGTTVSELHELSDWLDEHGCGSVAMESTGVYWKPVFHILRLRHDLTIGNSRDIKQRPGRKTDKADADWIAELHAHGLISPSFIPPPEIDALRQLTRTRTGLVNTRTQAKNRVHKLLQEANIKLSNVASDIFGVSGRAMLDALVAGERDPEKLSSLARGTLRRKIPQLALALEGHFTTQHALLLRLSLQLIDTCSDQIRELDTAVQKLVEPMQSEIVLLDSIPGIDENAARQILAETGRDMSRFESASRMASWACICPGNNESAGKRKTGRTRKGGKWLKRILVECAWAARKTDSHLGMRFRSLERRLGGKKAAVAVGHQILVIIWHVLTTETPYEDSRYAPSSKQKERRLKGLLKALKEFGYDAELKPATA